MESAVSTEIKMDAIPDRQNDLHCIIAPHVRVRRESFGLLFYNTENSSLTFVKSADHLEIRVLSSREKVIIATARKPEMQVRIKNLFDHLSRKRLLRES